MLKYTSRGLFIEKKNTDDNNLYYEQHTCSNIWFRSDISLSTWDTNCYSRAVEVREPKFRRASCATVTSVPGGVYVCVSKCVCVPSG